MKLPESVKFILDELHSHGYEAYAVGGCVRDALLGREPEDWDVTTSAEPEQIKAVFPVTIDTGIEHGTVTVRHEQVNYEVTTFRIDGKYKDHRHPEEVHFAKSLQEDLLRRDFTINAMAYSEETGIIDLYGGQQDLADGIIRAVGVAKERFEEDALRILRAFRFAAQLSGWQHAEDTTADAKAQEEAGPAAGGASQTMDGQMTDEESRTIAKSTTDAGSRTFVIEEETRAAIRACREGLRDISAERIQVEMTKILTSNHPQILQEMYELGVTAIFLPEFDAIMETEQHNPHHNATVGGHSLQAVAVIEPQKALRWTMLIHDMGKPECKSTDEEGIDHFFGHAAKSQEIAGRIMDRMKMDNATRDTVRRLVYYHDYRFPMDADLAEQAGDHAAAEPGIHALVASAETCSSADLRRVRRAINKIGEAYFADYCKVRRADVLAQSDYCLEEKLANLDAVDACYAQIVKEQQCVSLKELAVTGQDLIAAGVQPGPEIGAILDTMLDWVLDDPTLNTREALLAKWQQA